MAKLVLIVEDNDDHAFFIETALQHSGYRVARVADGLAALPAVRSLRPELVVLDISLPGLTGWEIARGLSADRELSQIPVIGVSSHHAPVEMASRGLTSYLRKPFDTRHLVAEANRLTRPRADDSWDYIVA